MPRTFTVPTGLQGPVALGYEVDAGLLRLYDRSLDRLINEVIEDIKELPVFRSKELGIARTKELNTCWTLLIWGEPATFSESKKAAFRVAKDIGIFPAKMYEFLPEYDENFDQLYHKELMACCSMLNPYCVRPGHLRMCNRNRAPLRTSLSATELELRLRAVQRSHR